MKTTLREKITEYWDVQPPHKGCEEFPKGSLEWYRSISEHRYRVVPYMKEYVGFESYAGKKVLEIGCGAGTDLCEFARSRALVTGIDITDSALSLARERLAVEGLAGAVVKYDGRRLPFDGNSFDLVYSWGVLHHSPYMGEIYAEAHRVLVKGGELKLMLYHRKSLLYYYSILYLRMVQQGMVEGRDELLSAFSEFRSGCPFTQVLSPAEIQERLWYFSRVKTTVDYCVYDTPQERKRPGNHRFDLPPCGVADLDAFFTEFNASVEAGEDLRKYGWHLLVSALK